MLLVVVPLALVTYGLCTAVVSYQPVVEALPEAQNQAHEQKFVTHGYFGDIIKEPDIMGGCVVRIGFTDATKIPAQQIIITLRRHWTFGDWHVVEWSTRVWGNPGASSTLSKN